MPKKEKPCIGKTFVVGSIAVTVEDVIAEGGFALVFLTRNSSGRRYALKRMYVNTEKDLAMCQQEIFILEALAKEHDSFVVRYWASVINVVDEEVKEVLILLDYYKSSVLQLMNERFQSKRQLSEEEVLSIFCDVCHAVGKLHNQRVPWIHRDLKVENILIDKDGRCVLCDFGSATNRIFDPAKHSISDMEEDLKKYTTIAYRSPEMVNLYGLKKPITTKADIWALGVMLYKMCYFVLPFGESALAIQNCNLQFPSQPVYSKQLQGLIRYCLKVDPEERPDVFQVAYVACAMANRQCAVPNRHKVQVPTLETLLSQPETTQAPIVITETSPPRLIRPPASQTLEFSNTTSIAPRERPKASTPAASVLVLPPPPSKFGAALLAPVNLQPTFSSEAVASANPGSMEESFLVDVTSRDNFSSRSPFQPVAGAMNPFRNSNGSTDVRLTKAEDINQRAVRMGHRRNTSDTSMIPVARPLSPTPTQNNSEKSRSADTSPVRSPNSRTDTDKKFSTWNPFEDSENWIPPKTPSLTQSITSLVRRGSASSASRTTLASPVENGEKEKLKPKTAERKEKKKFKYQKFDNDSDVEEGSSTEPVSVSKASSKMSSRSDSTKTSDDADTVKDTDSIGSASDLKHEDDTTDDEHLSSHRSVQPEIKVEEEEEDEHYDTVQYGTLEETASAIQSLASQRSIGQETSTKPLLGDHNGLDKSDDDELDRRPLPAPQPTQRRSTFEAMGLLSVFDQIPFRQPKKSKETLLPTKKDVSNSPANVASHPDTLGSNQVFPETNPFADCFYGQPAKKTSVTEKTDGSFVSEKTPLVAVAPPPPVPPKPSFLKRDFVHTGSTGMNFSTSSPGYSTDSGEDMFGSSPFDNLTESLVMDDRQISSVPSGGKKKARSPVISEPLIHSSNVVAPSSPKLSKSPNRSSRFRKFQEKEGISNISFEDA